MITMLFLQVALAVVFLHGNDAETFVPNLSDCTLKEYECDVRKCDTHFVKSVQQDPKGDCGIKYERTLNCVIMSSKLCGRSHPKLETPMEVLLRRGIPQKAMCDEGLLGGYLIDYEQGDVAYNCTSLFPNNTKTCLKTFHEKFSADKSDPTLCKEQATAKQCWKRVMKSDCKFPSQVEEALDVALGDFNPFCANNRDPGATGKDECYGVRDINNPYNAATAKLKISVLRALFVVAVSSLSFIIA